MWRIIGIMKREKYIILDALNERRKKMKIAKVQNFQAGDIVRFRSGHKVWEVCGFSSSGNYVTLIDLGHRMWRYYADPSSLVLVEVSHV